MLMNVKPMMRGLRGTRRGFRGYQSGTYPVPGWAYGAPAPATPCCGQGNKGLGRLLRARMRALGYTGPYDASLSDSNPVATSPSVATATGSIFVNYNPANWVPSGPAPITPPSNVYPVAPGGASLTSEQLAQLTSVIGPATAAAASTAPGISAAGLLAAAAMPNAPAVVKQAAAQYQAANPVSATLAGTIGGIPTTYLLLGGGALLLLLMAGGSGRRR